MVGAGSTPATAGGPAGVAVRREAQPSVERVKTPLEELIEASAALAAAQRSRDDAVRHCLAFGAGYSAVAEVLGISRQAVQKRFAERHEQR